MTRPTPFPTADTTACGATCVAERGAALTGRRSEGHPAPTDADRADLVREAIERAGLTLYRVSALTSARRVGRGAHGVVTHTLYRDIRAGHAPTVPQLASLSRVTGRPLDSWLSIFGVDLSTLASLQIAMHRSRTIRLSSRAFDSSMTVPHWERWSVARDPRRIQRLIDGVEGERVARAHEIDRAARRRFLYLSVGTSDPWRAPETAARSIVRVDPRQSAPRRFGHRRAIYAVAHAYGLSCCYVDVLSPTHVALFGAAAQAAPMVCRLGHDAAILGRVDAELRLLDRAGREACATFATPRQTGPVVLPDRRRDTFGRFVHRSRALIGLTFREASALTECVAAHCADERFHLSVGALCNYETLDTVPGSPHALFSLAAIYAVDFWDLLGVGRVRTGRQDATWPVSGDERSSEESSPQSPSASEVLSPWMEGIVRRCLEVPLFLAPALTVALGASHIDAQDVYLWGSGQKRLDPRLEGALVVAIDRHDRRLAGGGSRASAEPPLFMLRLPNDAYICCAASLHESCVIVHPSPELGVGPRCFPREHLEVIGRVSAILRRVVS